MSPFNVSPLLCPAFYLNSPVCSSQYSLLPRHRSIFTISLFERYCVRSIPLCFCFVPCFEQSLTSHCECWPSIIYARNDGIPLNQWEITRAKRVAKDRIGTRKGASVASFFNDFSDLRRPLWDTWWWTIVEFSFVPAGQLAIVAENGFKIKLYRGDDPSFVFVLFGLNN